MGRALVRVAQAVLSIPRIHVSTRDPGKVRLLMVDGCALVCSMSYKVPLFAALFVSYVSVHVLLPGRSSISPSHTLNGEIEPRN